MKKAQLQIQETMLVIFVFVIMILIAFVVFNKFTLAAIMQDHQQYQITKSRNLIGYLPSLPELKCSSLGIDSECIDILKFKAYAAQNPDVGYKKISLTIIYPAPESAIKIDKKPANILGEEKISSLVSVYDPKSNEYKIGNLEITRYSYE